MENSISDIERRLLFAQLELEGTNWSSQDLPSLATDALVAGLDTPTLRVLAGEPSSDPAADDNRELFRKVLRELGRDPLQQEQALWDLARFICTDIVAGRLSPQDGARQIGELLGGHPRVPYVYDLVASRFSRLSDQWIGEWGPSRPEVECEILRAAEDVLASASAEDMERRPWDYL